MKRLEELGVSPAPWQARETGAVSAFVLDGDGKSVFFGLADNARLIAAAPDLYEALRGAVETLCRRCVSDGDYCAPWDGYCSVRRWRKALEKAGGEE